jgi:hypothetical protein
MCSELGITTGDHIEASGDNPATPTGSLPDQCRFSIIVDK